MINSEIEIMWHFFCVQNISLIYINKKICNVMTHREPVFDDAEPQKHSLKTGKLLYTVISRSNHRSKLMLSCPRIVIYISNSV